MFTTIHQQAAVLHGEMKALFWLLLPPLMALLIVMELLKSEAPNVREIIRRTVIAIVLLLSFNFVMETLAILSNGISDRIGKDTDLLQAVKSFQGSLDGQDIGFFDFRKHVIFFFAIVAYLLSYVGYFASVALINFVWAVLYVFSPLMILCYVPRGTAGVTLNLYRGLVHVSLWKIVYTLLGALLLKMSINPQSVGIDQYLLSLVTNLMIGLSMLLVPLFTKSLITDGLTNVASGLAAAPGLLSARTIATMAKRGIPKAAHKAGQGAEFISRPLTNPLTGRARILSNKMKLDKRWKKAKENYGNLGLPKKAIKLKQGKNKHRRHGVEKRPYQGRRRPLPLPYQAQEMPKGYEEPISFKSDEKLFQPQSKKEAKPCTKELRKKTL